MSSVDSNESRAGGLLARLFCQKRAFFRRAAFWLLVIGVGLNVLEPWEWVSVLWFFAALIVFLALGFLHKGNRTEYTFNVLSLWCTRKIDLRTVLYALKNRPSAVAGRGGSYHVDPIDPNE